MEAAWELAAPPHLGRSAAGSTCQQSEHVMLNCCLELLFQIFIQTPPPYKNRYTVHTVSAEIIVASAEICWFCKFCHLSHTVHREVWFSVLKICPASVGRRQIKVDLINFSMSCSCPKSCTFHKHFLVPKIETEDLLLTQLKFHLKKTLYLDGLPVLKTKNPIFRNSLGHPGVQSCIF